MSFLIENNPPRSGFLGYESYRAALKDPKKMDALLFYDEKKGIETLVKILADRHQSEFREYAYFLLYHFRDHLITILKPLSEYLYDHPILPSRAYFTLLREVTLAAAVFGFPSIERLLQHPARFSTPETTNLEHPLDPRSLCIMLGYLSDLILQLVALHKWRLEPADPSNETPEQAYVRMHPLPKGVPLYGVMLKIEKGAIFFKLPSTPSLCVRSEYSGRYLPTSEFYEDFARFFYKAYSWKNLGLASIFQAVCQNLTNLELHSEALPGLAELLQIDPEAFHQLVNPIEPTWSTDRSI